MTWNEYKKEYVVWLHNVRTGLFYDISKAVNNITITTQMYDHPGELTIDIINNENLPIEEGSSITIDYGQWSGENGTHVYFGFIFKIFHDETNEHKDRCLCYDQLRYLKNTFTIDVEGQTTDKVFNLLCDTFKIPHFIKNDTKGFVLPGWQFDNDTGFNILKYCLESVQVYMGETYIIRDEFGWLYLENIRNLGKNYWLKYGESIKKWNFNTDIDTSTYNVVEQIWDTKDGQELPTRSNNMVYDSESMMQYGYLKLTEKIDGFFADNAKAIEALNKKQLAYKNKAVALDIRCIGLPELKAGDLVCVTLPIDLSPNSYKQDFSFLVRIEKSVLTINNGEDESLLTIVPLTAKWSYNDFVDTGVGALKDQYEEERIAKEKMRAELNLTRTT